MARTDAYCGQKSPKSSGERGDLTWLGINSWSRRQLSPRRTSYFASDLTVSRGLAEESEGPAELFFKFDDLVPAVVG